MQSAKLQLFNYLYEKFLSLNVPVIETKDLNQQLDYPFIAIQSLNDHISRLTFDSYSGNPSVTVHLWGINDDKAMNDQLYLQVQNILLNDVYLEGYTLVRPNINVNEIIDTTSNQELLHTIINIEYESH
ncbi:hypothetical protein K4Q22_10075 [Staphylococcus epidermidis]|jgi:hypothetical protein|uniref:hypothetical protein n=1 Tax=Staphylococcus epidermidis TaxID=1282 RepID=UPI0007E45B60|nr:hypothetical protein [Staphylococcus epidermidis]DAK63691.1 MAG TPA: hypothetical protein [Caudoviricetes sp.]MCG1213929.1 hypothetical protein [Staphylococcus epidermidis]MCG1271895.1 hypothetical protein [Staphylococcus epidermidis]MCG1550657.1 hypothetical protein [Staphylococcus epidermidis]MCG1593961.1 hypothetical protein [Staphylococcus epidermidis]